MCSILGYCGKPESETLIPEIMQRTISRGPDATRTLAIGGGYLGFNRLSIMGLTPEGMQPFQMGNSACVCNGEIYGFRPLKAGLIEKGYTFKSDSDCEILLPLYKEYGCGMFRMLDAEYALVLYDGDAKEWIAARDPIGIRPLYYGEDKNGTMVFASEPKSLIGICDRIKPFPPGCYYKGGKFVTYHDPARVMPGTEIHDDVETACKKIHDKLVSGVMKRLDSDTPVGFLLSGGLDSSLVCGISAKIMGKPLETFAIGMDIDAIDLKYAREVAEYIGANHHEVIITRDDVINALDPVIKALGTWDITTVRASVGMYLVCKYIHENTDIRVIMTGEISDELFGYKYTDFAPSAEEFQKEAEKRIREINVYDVLRADRCISVNSLEARVPFGDLDFVDYVMHLDPALKMNTYGIGKYLPRHAFEKDALIPHDILMRQKAAFSDAVGHSLRSDIVDYAESLYTDEEFKEKCAKYSYCAPYTKESLLYREVFEKYYPDQAEMIPAFWLPNQSWDGCKVDDPSARFLSNYGASGQ